MSEEDRAEREAKWDSRKPLERFESLTHQEQSAFIALFAGGRTHLQGAWSPERGAFHISFGKAECEWVGMDFWRYKLPGLRLTNYEEGPRRCALGMAVGSVVWDIYITVTEDGRQAREGYWAETRERSRALASDALLDRQGKEN